MRYLPVLALLGLAILPGCAKEEAEVEESVVQAPQAPPSPASPAPAPAAAPDQGAPGSPPQPPAVQNRKLIRTVELDLAVKDTGAAAARVQEIVAAHGGFVEAMNAQQDAEDHARILIGGH